ncbi:Hsp33 family molecular chaperone HslO, partial [Pseudomonas sp.]
ARGLLLQQLPADRLKESDEREASWQHAMALADTLKAEELLGLDNETLLHRLYHQEALRLFDPRDLQFRCSCSRERSSRALISLGQADAEALVQEHGGSVEIDCQFCSERYLFDAADVLQLFIDGSIEAPSDTRH